MILEDTEDDWSRFMYHEGDYLSVSSPSSGRKDEWTEFLEYMHAVVALCYLPWYINSTEGIAGGGWAGKRERESKRRGERMRKWVSHFRLRLLKIHVGCRKFRLRL